MTRIFKRREPSSGRQGKQGSELERIWAAEDNGGEAPVAESPVEAGEAPVEAVKPRVEPAEPAVEAPEADVHEEVDQEAQIAEARREAEERVAGEGERRLIDALNQQRLELETEAEKRIDEARREAEAEAHREAEELIADAKREAEEEVAKARREAEDLVAEVRRETDEEIARLRRELEARDAERREALAHREAVRAALREVETSAAARPGPPPPVGEVDLAAATYDELRALGLSVTQANRVLRYRDQKGVDSVERLDEVPGLPKTLIDQLKQRLAA